MVASRPSKSSVRVQVPVSAPKMTKEEVVADIESLTEYYKGILKDPKHSSKAGLILTMFKKLNKVFDKMEDVRNRK